MILPSMESDRSLGIVGARSMGLGKEETPFNPCRARGARFLWSSVWGFLVEVSNVVSLLPRRCKALGVKSEALYRWYDPPLLKAGVEGVLIGSS